MGNCLSKESTYEKCQEYKRRIEEYERRIKEALDVLEKLRLEYVNKQSLDLK